MDSNHNDGSENSKKINLMKSAKKFVFINESNKDVKPLIHYPDLLSNNKLSENNNNIFFVLMMIVD